MAGKKQYSAKDWTIAGVNLAPHMMDLGADYLKVPGRVLLFRAAHPHGAITTDLVRLEDGFAMFRATVTTADGVILAVAHGSETLKGFPNGFIEKAETVAVGRALASAGFGTQFAAADFTDHMGKLVDAPVASKEPPAPMEWEMGDAQQRRLRAVMKEHGCTPDALAALMKKYSMGLTGDPQKPVSTKLLIEPYFDALVDTLIPDWRVELVDQAA